MRKICKIILLVAAVLAINTPFLYAKTNVNHAKFFSDILRPEKYISLPDSEDAEISLPDVDEKDISDKANVSVPRPNKSKSVYESIAAAFCALLFVLWIIKALCENFKIPFDYDPNIKSKHVVYKRARNKKYKFQKR